MFEVKDSGKRQAMGGGMVRDTEDGKVDYTLLLDGPMLDRWATHMTKGGVKYSPRNWLKSATGTNDEIRQTMDRFRRSAFRHFLQWMRDDREEDHAAALVFNVNGYEHLRGVLTEREGSDVRVPDDRPVQAAHRG